ncbi:MAG: hypothetical protein HYY24_19245 [Verrucomicrobia bacterium]|nr:hypothetical protein [Verrucomicrobiota bacterium]
MTTEDSQVWFNLAVAFGIVAVLCTLAVMLCREWVKTDLRERGFRPLSVRWRPFTFPANELTCGFNVQYSDSRGLIHKARCWTYWHRPSVTWEKDEIVGEVTTQAG